MAPPIPSDAPWCTTTPNRPARRAGIGAALQRQFDGAVRPVEREAFDRPAQADDDVMAAGRREATGGDAADAAHADHGYGQTLLGLRGGGHVK